MDGLIIKGKGKGHGICNLLSVDSEEKNLKEKIIYKFIEREKEEEGWVNKCDITISQSG